MSKFFALVKKEIKELITIQLIIPILVMVFVFAAIGSIISGETEKSLSSSSLWLLDNDRSELSSDLVSYFNEKRFETIIKEGSIEEVLSEAREAKEPGFIVIPQDFSEKVSESQKPSIETYRLADSFSLSALRSQARIDRAFSEINSFVQNKWLESSDISVSSADFQSPLEKKEISVVGENRAEAPFMAVLGFIQKQTTIVPVIIFLVIVVAAQMVATAVASEKESKTLETLLSLPIGRKTIVFAKLLAAGLVSFLFAGFYLFGFSRYINGITGAIPGSDGLAEALGPALAELGINFGFYDYIILGASLFLGILAALAIALMLGLLAENVKGVQAVVTPLMLIILIPYLLTMFVDLSSSSLLLKSLVYGIPFSYPFLAMQKLLLGEVSFVLFGIVYQFIFLIAVVFMTTYIFSGEKILTMRLGRKKH